MRTAIFASLRLEAGMAELPRLGAWLDGQVAALGLTGRPEYALRLCVEELVANVLLHAGATALTLSLAGPPLMLLLEDDGGAFDPTQVAEPELAGSLEAAATGGRGIALARRYSGAWTHARRDGLNRLTVAF